MSSVHAVAQVEIARPRGEVARFMFDPRNDPIWTVALIDSRSDREGLLEKGARVERTTRFLGRRMTFTVECTGSEPERSVELLATTPFEMHVRYELEDAGPARTRASIRTEGGGTGFFKLAGPLLSRLVQRQIQADLDRLREHLEG